MIDPLIDAVPVGFDNAVNAQAIWRVLDCWAPSTISNRLNRLAEAGAIRRRKVPIATGAEWTYWRDDVPSAGALPAAA